RTKNGEPFIIPLSPPAMMLLTAETRRVEPDGSPRDLVFGRGPRPFQNWSVSKKLLDEAIATRGKTLAPWCLHDFRRSLSTALHERFKVPPHVVEALLGHAGGHKSGVAGVYNKAIYLDERRRALDVWSEHVLAVVEKRGSKVIPLRA